MSANEKKHEENESYFFVQAEWEDERLKSIVKDQKFQDQLRTKGFGEMDLNEYTLFYYETLYLLDNKRLSLKVKEKDISFNDIFNNVIREDKTILTRYLIYRDLKNRGYVIKEGFGFGADFRVYDRGDYEKKQSKFVVFALNEGINMKITNFSKNINKIEKMGKKAIIAVIERRGEVIYYKANSAQFPTNKFDISIREKVPNRPES